MKNITILGSYSGFNKGDLAILCSMVQNLKKIDKKIIVNVPSKKPEIIKRFLPNDVKIYKTTTSYLSLTNLKYLTKTDIFVIGGGGLFFDKNIFNPFYNHIVNLFVIILINKLFLHKPVYLFSVGSSHLKSKWGLSMTKFILNNADIITVRDSHTLTLFSTLTKKPIKIFYDPAFLLEPEKNTLIDNFFSSYHNQDKKVIFALNDFLFSIKKEKNYIKDLISVINKLQDDYNVVLYQNDTKCKFIKLLYKKCRQDKLKIFNPVDLSPQEIIYLFSKFDLSICAPMHAAIFSYNAGVSLMTITYDDKVYEFNKIINNSYIFKLNNMQDILIQLKEDIILNTDKKYDIKDSCLSNFNNLSNFIKNVQK